MSKDGKGPRMTPSRKREKIIAKINDLPNGHRNEDTRKVKKKMEDIPVADPQKDLKGINGIIVEVKLSGVRKASWGRSVEDQR